jgi:predicted transcriptional regulator
VLISVSSSGGGTPKSVLTRPQSNGAYFSPAAARAEVKRTLGGIAQAGNRLGDPHAPVTITDYGDLVCPVCAYLAATALPQIIDQLVRTGKAQLVYKSADTASSYRNQAAFVTDEAGVLSAGLQRKAWDYILLVYDEQPQTIAGQHAEDVAYVTPAYMQSRAQQIAGLDLVRWQANLSNPAVIAQVKAEAAAAATQAPNGTPAIIVSGPKGRVTYDANGQLSVVPTVAQVQALMSRVS